jgi:hypothetical protein
MTARRLSVVILANLFLDLALFGQADDPEKPDKVRFWISAFRSGRPVTDLKNKELRLRVENHVEQVADLAFNLPDKVTGNARFAFQSWGLSGPWGKSRKSPARREGSCVTGRLTADC